MKTGTVTILTGWRALLAWVAIFAAFVTYWEVGKAIYCSLTDRHYSVFGFDSLFVSVGRK